MRRFTLLLLAVASVVLFVTLRRIAWTNLFEFFLQGVRYWWLLLVPYALTSYLWAVSWSCLLTGTAGAPSPGRLFFLRLAGESLNQLTPTASLGGEPFKALRLHALGVAWPQATASLVVHKALMVLSLVLYILLGLALVPVVLPGIPPRIAWLCCLGTLLLAAAGISFLIVQRRNPCISFLSLLDRFGLCPAVLRAHQADLAALDQALTDFYREHAAAGLLGFFFLLLGWLAQSLEVALIFWLLGHPVNLGLALSLDALSQLVAGLGFMIPASLGVQDSGNILLSLGFNLGSTLGAGFSILRRLREAFWLLLGLIVVVRER